MPTSGCLHPFRPPHARCEGCPASFQPWPARAQALDGGVLGNSPPSTVVDCTQPQARLVREGALKVAELRRAAGRLAP